MNPLANASSAACRSEIRVGVSSCLLGHAVRYDGGHKRNAYVTEVLGRIFCLVAVCPEFEVGMPVPREILHLVRTHGRVRMVAGESGRDWTEPMHRFSSRWVRELKELAVSAYILKQGSPSCGLRQVPIVTSQGLPSESGRGLFADMLLRSIPSLPVEEESRLEDPVVRKDFIARVRAYHRTQLPPEDGFHR